MWHNVQSTSRLQCSAQHQELCALDGHHYLFVTSGGTFAGVPNTNNPNNPNNPTGDNKHTYLRVGNDALSEMLQHTDRRSLLAPQLPLGVASGVLKQVPTANEANQAV